MTDLVQGIIEALDALAGDDEDPTPSFTLTDHERGVSWTCYRRTVKEDQP